MIRSTRPITKLEAHNGNSMDDINSEDPQLKRQTVIAVYSFKQNDSGIKVAVRSDVLG